MKNERVLLVTGASSDIGVALIDSVVNSYSMVIAQYNHFNLELQVLGEKHGDKIWFLEADLSNNNSIIKMIEVMEEKKIVVDHVVHLAAMKAENSQFRKESWSKVTNHMDVSVKSIYLLLQAIFPQMIKQKYGKVIFMLTSYIVGVPPKFQSSYIMSKYALLGLMKTLSVEYIDHGITVNGVSPDMINTKFIADLPRWIPEKNASESLLGRNLTVDEVVPVFQYLLSDGADVLTGQNIEIINKG